MQHPVSLSTWSSPAKLPTFVDPTEKYLLPNRTETNGTAMNQESLTDKRHLLESESLDPLICVNPYEVNPLSTNSDIPCAASLTAEIPLKVESSVSQRNRDVISCGGFYNPQRKIKLEMEEFGDLSPFVLRKLAGTNSIDELNTPIFDKDAFDFDINNYRNNVQADLHVMLKCDASFYRGGAQSAINRQPRQDFTIGSNKDIFLNTDTTRRNITILPLENMRHNTDATLYSPPASENGTYVEKMSPNTTSALEYDMNNSVSVNLDSRNPSPYGEIQIETPDGSERSYNPSPNYKSSQLSPSYKMYLPHGTQRSYQAGPKLSLDISLGNHSTAVDLSTPGVIAEVVNLEETGFNILDLINEDNIEITPEDIFLNPSAQLPVSSQQSHPKLDQPRQRAATKQPRRRRTKCDDDDEDEDYIPPCKISTGGFSRKSRTPKEYLTSDSEYEEEEVPRKKARGRPPKRAESVSSDCSKDSDISRYRELREKNNEASRKSRLKRKLKDLDLEKEAEELHSKNIKLKAQVEELEKMVNNFRDNLFKILINK